MTRPELLEAARKAVLEIEGDLIAGRLLPEDGGEIHEAIEAATAAAGRLQDLLDYLGI